MREIDRAIRQKEAALEELRRDLDALRRARDVLAKDEGVTGAEASPAATRARRDRDGDLLRPGSAVFVTLAILRERGATQHVDVLIPELKARGVEAKRDSLVSSLAKLAKRRRYVYRAAPSTFGLIEWQQSGDPIAEPVTATTH